MSVDLFFARVDKTTTVSVILAKTDASLIHLQAAVLVPAPALPLARSILLPPPCSLGIVPLLAARLSHVSTFLVCTVAIATSPPAHPLLLLPPAPLHAVALQVVFHVAVTIASTKLNVFLNLFLE